MNNINTRRKKSRKITRKNPKGLTYKRFTYYDHKDDNWKTFHRDKNEKIVFDAKSRTLKDLKKKTAGKKWKSQTLKKSDTSYMEVQGERDLQAEIDRTITKIKRVKDPNKKKDHFKKLKEMSRYTDYRKQAVRGIQKKIKVPEGKIRFGQKVNYMMQAKTGSNFWIAKPSFENILEKIKRYGVPKSIIFTTKGGAEVEGAVTKTDFRNIHNFNTLMADLIADNEIDVSWERDWGRMLFKW